MEKRRYNVSENIISTQQKHRRLMRNVNETMASYGLRNSILQQDTADENRLAGENNVYLDGANFIPQNVIEEEWAEQERVQNDAIKQYLADTNQEERVEIDMREKAVDDVADHFLDIMDEGRGDDDDFVEEEDEDLFFDCEEREEEAPSFKDALIELVITSQPDQTFVDKLLHTCKLLPDYESLNLPLTCTTLLKTQRKTPVRTVAPGYYYHFGLLKNILEVLENHGVVNVKSNELNLQFNIDGLPTAKSSNSQFWPILGLIKDLPGSCPFSVGIFHGYKKPSDPDDYLKEFVEELNHLLHTGIDYKGKILKIGTVNFVCDAPAKAAMTRIKSHSGFYSCSRCVVKGEWIDGRVVYLEEDAERRDDDSFRNPGPDDKHHTGVSSLLNLPGINMVFDFILDYMHLVCLGVMKKLLLHWIRGPLSTRLSNTNINLISNRLIAIAEFFPREFARKPRSLHEIARWKATEFRQFLLYTGPVVLKGVLDDDLYNHFMMLHVAIKILVNKDFCIKDNLQAKTLLVSFVKNCKNLYGDTFIVYNVHNLIHLADDVLYHQVPLDMISGFPFENHLQQLLKLRRKHERPLQQIVRRLGEISRNAKSKIIKKSGAISAKGIHTDGPLCLLRGLQYTQLSMKGFFFNCKNCQDCNLYLKNFKIVKVLNFVQSDNGYFIVGREYIRPFDLYKIPCESSKLDIYSVKNVSEIKYWPLSSIICKALVFPFGNKQKLAAFPIYLQSHEKL